MARRRRRRAVAPEPVPSDTHHLVERVLAAPDGTVVAVVAPSGFGKSALLDAIADRGSDRDLVIVDDAHAIRDPDAKRGLAATVRSANRGLTVVAARCTPPIGVARLKLDARLIVIDEHDLGLGVVDVRQTLEQRSAPACVDAAMAELARWRVVSPALVAGVAAALSRTRDRADVVAAVQGASRRFVRDRVLPSLSGELRRFALELAFIGEFDVETARVVTGRNDTADVLAEVVDHRLFLEAAPDRPGNIRFVAPFAEAAAHQLHTLGSDRLRDLDRRLRQR